MSIYTFSDKGDDNTNLFLSDIHIDKQSYSLSEEDRIYSYETSLLDKVAMSINITAIEDALRDFTGCGGMAMTFHGQLNFKTQNAMQMGVGCWRTQV